MRTANCEGCGCDWKHPCMTDPATGKPIPVKEQQKIMAGTSSVSPLGCHWDPEYWKAGRAVCSVCVSERKVTA